MKKSIIAAGAASVALAAMPIVGAFATYTGSYTDVIQTTIGETCTFSRGTIASAAATHPIVATESWAADTPTAGTDTMSAVTLNPGAAVETKIGSSNFKVICNANVGYKVTVAASGLALPSTSTQNHPWVYKYDGAVSDAASYWRIAVPTGEGQALATNVISTKASSTDGTDITVEYYAWAQSGQDAGTYSATAAYTFAAP